MRCKSVSLHVSVQRPFLLHQFYMCIICSLCSVLLTEVARAISRELGQQVEAFKRVASSLSMVTAVSASDLSASFRSLESNEMQTEDVSPGSLEICSRHLRGMAAPPLPFCHYETVPYRYAHEAFRLTLAQRGVQPHTWFRFFSMNHETIVTNCMSEARRLSAKKSAEDFIKLAEWRRLLPVALANAIKALRAGFAGPR